jgi:Arc/MetJ family transcription regulator
MPTNLGIDDKLIAEAQQLGRHRTKKEAVNDALREYIRRLKQRKIVDLFGKIEIDPGFHYKNFRKR